MQSGMPISPRWSPLSMNIPSTMKSNRIPPLTLPVACRRRAASRAFSLVETALALGIVGFAFVGLMGMLPAGLATFRSAVDTTVGAQIAQRVAADAQQADFDKLVPKSSTDFVVLETRYFDDQGNEVKQTSLSKIYEVRTRASAPGSPDSDAAQASNFTSLPDKNGTRFHPRDSTILTIQIANNPSGKKLAEDSTTKLWTVPQANLTIMMQSAVVTRSQGRVNP